MNSIIHYFSHCESSLESLFLFLFFDDGEDSMKSMSLLLSATPSTLGESNMFILRGTTFAGENWPTVMIGRCGGSFAGVGRPEGQEILDTFGGDFVRGLVVFFEGSGVSCNFICFPWSLSQNFEESIKFATEFAPLLNCVAFVGVEAPFASDSDTLSGGLQSLWWKLNSDIAIFFWNTSFSPARIFVVCSFTSVWMLWHSISLGINSFSSASSDFLWTARSEICSSRLASCFVARGSVRAVDWLFVWRDFFEECVGDTIILIFPPGRWTASWPEMNHNSLQPIAC